MLSIYLPARIFSTDEQMVQAQLPQDGLLDRRVVGAVQSQFRRLRLHYGHEGMPDAGAAVALSATRAE
ncbi:hypothetical protein [Povalibacter sp.]|uniref:hypothetical protein n=1 Tax=Povalibacter sp. TaxID=1962978 RepID=UPI002F3FE38F